MGMPYLGVIRGVKAGPDRAGYGLQGVPGVVMARMKVKLPAVLGILGAEQPPRYVPVEPHPRRHEIDAVPGSRGGTDAAAAVSVCKLHPPASGEPAEMLTGSEAAVAARIATILAEKGLSKSALQDVLVLVETR